MSTAIEDLVVSIQETLKANPRSSQDRFVEPMGADALRANFNHIVFGQRGAGKSSLLRRYQWKMLDASRTSVWIDCEPLKMLDVADLMSRICGLVTAELRRAIEDQLSTELGNRSRLSKLLRRETSRHSELRLRAAELEHLSKQMERLVHAPSNAVVEVEERQSAGSNDSAALGISVKYVQIQTNTVHAESAERSTKQTIETSKLQFLERSLVPVGGTIAKASDLIEGGFVFVDDFYQLDLAKQPHALGYLHALTKDTQLWVKVASIKYMTRTHSSAHPPVGMQLSADILPIALDRGLRDLAVTTEFLERVLGPIMQDHSLALTDLFTPLARQRLVLASGGVARDYLRIAAEALLEHEKRMIKKPKSSPKVGAEDVNIGAGNIAEGKRMEMELDSPESVSSVAELVDLLRDFCTKTKKAHFLTSTADKELSRRMEELQSMRFAHLLFTDESLPDKSSDRFDVWLLDLSILNNERATRNIDFDAWEVRTERRVRSLVFALQQEPDEAA